MTDTFTGELDRLTDGNRICRPPRTRNRAGRWVRADGGEWDWYYGLPASDREWIRAHHMTPNGLHPDVAADWAGLDIDAWAEQWTAAVRGARKRAAAGDPLDWELDEEPEPDGPTTYDDTMTRPELDLVGPVEVSTRAGVSRGAIAQWRRRYADFPAPVAVIGMARRGPRGGSGGTPVWIWSDVHGWLVATGRHVSDADLPSR
jgi:hypothetical protein